MPSHGPDHDDSCLLCRDNRIAEVDPPDLDNVYRSDSLRVLVREFNPEGWLLIVLRRHTASFAELTDDEATELGRVIRAASQALRAVLGVPRTYAFCFADVVAHLHINIVPRWDDIPAEFQGAKVLGYRSQPPVPDAARNALARRLRAAWTS